MDNAEKQMGAALADLVTQLPDMPIQKAATVARPTVDIFVAYRLAPLRHLRGDIVSASDEPACSPRSAPRLMEPVCCGKHTTSRGARYSLAT